MGIVNVGVDLGQRVDPTAIVVAELAEEAEQITYRVRFLQRLPLGTSYPDVARRLVEIGEKLAGHDITFFVDATGVGQPVLDILRERGLENVVAVYLTGGLKARRRGSDLMLPKALLVSRLQVLLQGRRIRLPKTREARALVEELQNFEIRVSRDGVDKYGAFRTGTHDDLVVALGLACWRELPITAENIPNPFFEPEEFRAWKEGKQRELSEFGVITWLERPKVGDFDAHTPGYHAVRQALRRKALELYQKTEQEEAK